MSRKILLAVPALGLLLAGAGTAVAQTTDGSDEVEGGTIIVTKSAESDVSDGFKMGGTPEMVEPRVDTTSYKPWVIRRQVDTEFELRPIKAARITGVKLPPLDRAYIKAGVGTNRLTFADAYVNNLRSRNKLLGARIQHLGSAGNVADKGHSGFSENLGELWGKKYMKAHLIAGGVEFSQNVNHFYDYDPDVQTELGKDDTRQRFNRYGANAQFMSFFKDSTMLNYDINLRYYHLDDFYNSAEDNVVLDTYWDRYFGNEYITLDGTFDFNTYRSALGTESNGILSLTPNIVSEGKKWKLKVGLTMAADADRNARFHFYPDAYLKYDVISDMLVPYLGLQGGLERNSFRSLTETNPFSMSDLVLDNSDTKYEFYGGVRGAFTSKASFNLRASKSRVASMPLFVNTENDIPFGQFDVVYDTVDVVNLRAEFSYYKTQKLHLLARGDYYQYNTTNEAYAWHRPNFQGTLSARYDMKDKIVVKADLIGISGQKARTLDPEEGEEYEGYDVYSKDLKGVIDVNLGVEYRYTKRLSAWLSFNNIGAARYNRWNGYPTQRFNVLGGLAYSFWGK